MELKLEKYIAALELTTSIHRQQEAPIIVRLTDDATGKATVVCCSYHQPKYVLLPIQAIWIDFNPESDTYQHAYRRTVKGATPEQDEWEVLYFYADAFPDQQYDPNDIGMISITLPPPATMQVHGIGYLTSPQAESRVVITGDARLTDKRDPLPHDEMHPEKPATIIRTGDGTSVAIASQVAPRLNDTLVADVVEGVPVYTWRHLKESDLEV